eukprot:Skav218276  [mRNA]  locus=scaffold2035:357888:361403:- [translate_table: standard]
MSRVPFIVGTWKGDATVINWQQFTKHAETSKPMHAENGRLGLRIHLPRFLKILPKPEEGEVKKAELMLSHPFSVNEPLVLDGGVFYKTCHFDFAQNILECLADTEDCFQRGPAAGGKIFGCSKYLRTEGSDEFVHHLHCEMEKVSE